MDVFRHIWRWLIILCLAWPKLGTAQSYIGGLHFMRSPDLVIERQDIALNLDKVSVDYVLNNTSNTDIIETLVFSFPMQNQFAVTVDNQPATYNIVQRALSFNGNDVSIILKNLGVAFDPVTAMQTIDASSNRESIRNRLISLELLDSKDETPKWFLKTFYYWQQRFPARSKVNIKQTYKPVILTKNLKLKSVTEIFTLPVKLVKKIFNVAVNWTFEDTIEDKQAAEHLQIQLEKSNPQIKQFCPSLKDYLALLGPNKKLDPTGNMVLTKELNYDYYSEDIWATPINHFSIAIESPKTMHPLLCWNGEFKQKTNNTLVFEADNYVPLQNINVLFVEK